jgi:hypothetical protein
MLLEKTLKSFHAQGLGCTDSAWPEASPLSTSAAGGTDPRTGYEMTWQIWSQSACRFVTLSFLWYT